MSSSLHRPAGSLADGDLAVSLTAAEAGWTLRRASSSFRWRPE